METITKLKSDIWEKLQGINDETALQLVKEAISEYGAAAQTDVLDQLTSAQQKRLQESIQQADEGNLLSNEEVKQIARSWLSK